MKRITIISIIVSILVLSLFSGASAGFSQINVNTAATAVSQANSVAVNNPTDTANSPTTMQVGADKNSVANTRINIDLNDKKDNTDTKNENVNSKSDSKAAPVGSKKMKVIEINKKIDLADIPINVDWSEGDNTPKPADSGSPVIEAVNNEKAVKPTTSGGVEIKPYYPIKSDVLKCTVDGKTSGFIFVWKVNDKVVLRGSSSLQNSFDDEDIVVCEAYVPTPFGEQYIGRGMVKVVNSPIKLSDYTPKEGNVNLYKDESKRFAISATDEDNDNINFVWYVDSKIAYSSKSHSMGEFTFNNTKTGNHTVKVEAYDGSMFNKKSKITIKWNINIIDKKPSFGFNLGPNPVLEGNNVTFSLVNLQPGSTNDPIRKIEWDFGDGGYITEGPGNTTTKVHSYAKQGTYNVKIVVTDAEDSVIKQGSVVVNDAQPSGSITASPTNIIEGENATFGINGLQAGSRTDAIKGVLWDFGDGKKSNQQNISHQYVNQGRYQVTLKISDQDSYKAESIFIYVNDTSPIISQPLVSNTPADEGSNITFGFLFGADPIAGSSVDSIKKYEWNFGDNSGIITTNGTTSTINHIYIDNGSYLASVKVWDSDSFSESTLGLQINDVNPLGAINTSATRVGLFYYYANVGELLNFSINGLANGSYTDVVKSIEWNMGNGVNFTTDSFNYLYPLNGSYNITLKIYDEDSFVEDFIVLNVADVNPSGDFEFENKSYYEGDTITFNAVNISSGASEDPVTNITWNFGDGENGTGNTVQHIYRDNATYNVTMTIHDSNSGVPVSHDIVINDVNPRGSINLSKNNVEKLENIHFSINGLANGSAIDVISRIEWNVNGFHVVDKTEFDMNFSNDGNYIVLLTITDEDSFIQDNVNFTVNDVAPAGVINSVDRVKEGDIVGFGINGFVNNSNDPVTSIVWDFGDGAVNDTNSLSVSHVYQDNGTYLVVLTITDSDSVVSSNKTIVVDDASPSGRISASKTNPLEGEDINVWITGLANGSSTDVITNIDWLLDGISQPAYVNQESFNTSFASKGVYNLTLVITDEDNSILDSVLINVGEAVPSGDIQVVPGTSIVEGDSLNFSINNLANGSAGDPITFVSWDFGDGTPVVLDYNATHTYAQNGSYSVVLTLRDANSVVAKSVIITVADTNPSINFLNFPSAAVEGDVISLNSSIIASHDPLGSIAWDFGDGNTATTTNATNVYAQNGTYLVKLTVADSDSFVTINSTIVVADTIPTADFAYTPLNPNPSDIVTFNSTVTGYDAPLTYSWDFGDGSAFDNNQNTTHNYTLDGYYIVNFKVTDADGSAVNVAKNITIGNDNGRLINSYLDLIYYSDNSTLTINGLDYSLIIDSNLTRPVSIRNSNVNSSVLVDVTVTSSDVIRSNLTQSTITNSNITDSNILRSNLRSCNVLRSTVIDVISSDCSITDSYVDPSDITGSNISTDSKVTYSNVTYSNVTSSNISNSRVNNSEIVRSEFDNLTAYNANITDNIIRWGNITTSDGKTYNVAPTDPPINLSDVNPYTPNVAFTVDSNSKQINVNFNFNASTTTDKNLPNDILVYNWDFNDSTPNSALLAPSHAYTLAGSYNVKLTVTDKYGLTNSTTHTITVTDVPVVTPSSPGPTGGGGGSSGKICEIKELLAEQKCDKLRAGDEIVFKYENFWYKVKILGFGSVMDFKFSPGDVKYYLNKTAQVNISLNDAKNLGVKYDKWDGSYGTVVLNLYDKKAVAAKTTVKQLEEPAKTTGMEEVTGNAVDVKFGEKDKAVEAGETHWYNLNISKRKLIGAGIAAGIVVLGMLVYFAGVGLFGGNAAVSSTSSTKKVNWKRKKNGK